MRALLPQPSPDVDVHSFYARDWVDVGGLRIDFVCSTDGAASTDGASRGLQTPGDNTVFAAMRDLADVVLAGAGTARTEGYRPTRLTERRRRVRADYGLPEHLPIALVSRSLNLDPTAALFTEAPEQARTIVLTCAAADQRVHDALAPVADVVVCGDEQVDLVAARAALQDRGLRRILCEGGPTLFADLAAAGVVDEVCLSITPLLVGPGPGRIVAGTPWHTNPHELKLIGLLEEDGALFCRYGRRS